MKIQNIWFSKDTGMKTKKQTKNQEKIFTRHVSDNKPVSQICKEFL